MPRGPQESGSKSPFRQRIGIDLETWTGVNKEGDPGALRDSELQEGINIRITPSGHIVNRGGQEKVNTSPLDGCITGIIDDEEDAPTKLMVLPDLAPDPIQMFDLNGAAFTAGSATTGAALRYAIGLDHTGQLVLVAGVGAIGAAVPIYSASRAALDAATAFSVYATLPAIPGETLHITSFVNLNGKLYLGVMNSSGTNSWRIYSYDGETDAFTLEDSANATSFRPRLIVDHNGDILFGIGGTTLAATVRRRSSAGVWSTVPLPGGVADFQMYAGCIYNGKTYLVGSTGGLTEGLILQWDGTALTVANGPIATVANVVVTGAVALGGYMYYLIHGDGGAAPTLARVGRYDGTTFTDAYKNLLTDFAAQGPSSYRAGGLVSIRGVLCAVAARYATSHVDILQAPPVDLSSTWTLAATASMTASGAANGARPPFVEL